MQAKYPNTALAQATALHEQLSRIIRPHPTPSTRILMVVMSLLAPIAAILYVISALKRQRTHGFWLFKKSDGYLSPNPQIVVPVFVVLYTALNLACLISIQVDFATVIKPRTVVFHMYTYPVLFAIAWTRVWKTLEALPPTKIGFKASRISKNYRGWPFSSPQALNSIAILAYAIPCAFSSVMAVIAARCLSEINTLWFIYEANWEARIDLSRLAQLTHSLLLTFRLTAAGYFIMLCVLLASAMYAYFRIFRVLYRQLRLLHNSFTQRMNDILSRPASSSSGAQGLPLSDLGDSDTGVSSVFDEKNLRSKDFPPKHRSAFKDMRPVWKTWLPHLQPNTEVDRCIWSSGLFTRTKEEWETAHKDFVYEQFKVLKRYTANTAWQAVLACTLVGSYMTLDAIIAINALDVPKKRTMAQMSLFIIEWGNVSWNLGTGISLGIVSCIVAFSQAPGLPTEPRALTEEHD